jgi:hypothetical protein
MSPTFKRERGYTFKIYSNEELRMHVHVISGDCSAKIWLEPKVELAENDGFANYEINKIIKLVEENADDFKQQYQHHIGKRLND